MRHVGAAPFGGLFRAFLCSVPEIAGERIFDDRSFFTIGSLPVGRRYLRDRSSSGPMLVSSEPQRYNPT